MAPSPWPALRPGRYQLNLYRGDDYAWTFALWSDKAKTIPVDLTGATGIAEIRDKPGGATVMPMIVSIALPNLVNVYLEDWTPWTPALHLTEGVWDLQLTLANGSVVSPLAGPVCVTWDVSATAVLP